MSDPEYSRLSKLFWAGENADKFARNAEALIAKAVRVVAVVRDEPAQDLVFVATSQPQVPWQWHQQIADIILNLK